MTYNGRRATNVSHFSRDIGNLNEIPSEQELSNFDFENDTDLHLFTNTTFGDYAFGIGQDDGLSVPDFGVNGHIGGTVVPDNLEMKPLDFTQGDFAYPDFTAFTQPQSFVREGHAEGLPTPIRTQNIYGASSAGSPSPNDLISPSGSGKRTKASSPAGENYEDASRLAAEEDKRRRNTAASARFRVKKKQREQALERSAKEMADKVAAYEATINQLTMENKWLKDLLTEKNESPEDIKTLYQQFQSSQVERKGSTRKDGVGTKA